MDRLTRIELISGVLDRFYGLNVEPKPERLSLFMSLDFSGITEEQLNALLTSHETDFVHDVAGIHHHIDCETKQLDSTFVPRCY